MTTNTSSLLLKKWKWDSIRLDKDDNDNDKDNLLDRSSSVVKVMKGRWTKNKSSLFSNDKNQYQPIILKFTSLWITSVFGKQFHTEKANLLREAEIIANCHALGVRNIIDIYGIVQGSVPAHISKACKLLWDREEAVGIMLEYQGRSLFEFIQDPVYKTYSIQEKCHLLCEIIAAISDLHSVNIIHGDIKSRNVLVSHHEPPLIKLIDFGLSDISEVPSTTDEAKTSTAVSTMQNTQQNKGTPVYFAPEMIIGTAEGFAKASRSTDMYAFGILSWEILTGKQAFQGLDVRSLLRTNSNTRPPIEDLPADTPTPLIQMITSCWDSDRTKRNTSIQCLSILYQVQDQLLSGHFDIFFSHAWINKPILSYFHEFLLKCGYRVWYDQNHMEFDMSQSMIQGIKKSKIVVICLNSIYVNRENCLFELRKAKEMNKTIITILLESNPAEWITAEVANIIDIKKKLYVDISSIAMNNQWNSMETINPELIQSFITGILPILPILKQVNCLPSFDPYDSKYKEYLNANSERTFLPISFFKSSKTQEDKTIKEISFSNVEKSLFDQWELLKKNSIEKISSSQGSGNDSIRFLEDFLQFRHESFDIPGHPSELLIEITFQLFSYLEIEYDSGKKINGNTFISSESSEEVILGVTMNRLPSYITLPGTNEMIFPDLSEKEKHFLLILCTLMKLCQWKHNRICLLSYFTTSFLQILVYLMKSIQNQLEEIISKWQQFIQLHQQPSKDENHHHQDEIIARALFYIKYLFTVLFGITQLLSRFSEKEGFCMSSVYELPFVRSPPYSIEFLTETLQLDFFLGSLPFEKSKEIEKEDEEEEALPFQLFIHQMESAPLSSLLSRELSVTILNSNEMLKVMEGIFPLLMSSLWKFYLFSKHISEMIPKFSNNSSNLPNQSTTNSAKILLNSVLILCLLLENETLMQITQLMDFHPLFLTIAKDCDCHTTINSLFVLKDIIMLSSHSDQWITKLLQQRTELILYYHEIELIAYHQANSLTRSLLNQIFHSFISLEGIFEFYLKEFQMSELNQKKELLIQSTYSNIEFKVIKDFDYLQFPCLDLYPWTLFSALNASMFQSQFLIDLKSNDSEGNLAFHSILQNHWQSKLFEKEGGSSLSMEDMIESNQMYLSSFLLLQENMKYTKNQSILSKDPLFHLLNYPEIDAINRILDIFIWILWRSGGNSLSKLERKKLFSCILKSFLNVLQSGDRREYSSMSLEKIIFSILIILFLIKCLKANEIETLSFLEEKEYEEMYDFDGNIDGDLNVDDNDQDGNDEDGDDDDEMNELQEITGSYFWKELLKCILPGSNNYSASMDGLFAQYFTLNEPKDQQQSSLNERKDLSFSFHPVSSLNQSESQESTLKIIRLYYQLFLMDITYECLWIFAIGRKLDGNFSSAGTMMMNNDRNQSISSLAGISRVNSHRKNIIPEENNNMKASSSLKQKGLKKGEESILLNLLTAYPFDNASITMSCRWFTRYFYYYHQQQPHRREEMIPFWKDLLLSCLQCYNFLRDSNTPATSTTANSENNLVFSWSSQVSLLRLIGLLLYSLPVNDWISIFLHSRKEVPLTLENLLKLGHKTDHFGVFIPSAMIYRSESNQQQITPFSPKHIRAFGKYSNAGGGGGVGSLSGSVDEKLIVHQYLLRSVFHKKVIRIVSMFVMRILFGCIFHHHSSSSSSSSFHRKNQNESHQNKHRHQQHRDDDDDDDQEYITPQEILIIHDYMKSIFKFFRTRSSHENGYLVSLAYLQGLTVLLRFPISFSIPEESNQIDGDYHVISSNDVQLIFHSYGPINYSHKTYLSSPWTSRRPKLLKEILISFIASRYKSKDFDLKTTSSSPEVRRNELNLLIECIKLMTAFLCKNSMAQGSFLLLFGDIHQIMKGTGTTTTTTTKATTADKKKPSTSSLATVHFHQHYLVQVMSSLLEDYARSNDDGLPSDDDNHRAELFPLILVLFEGLLNILPIDIRQDFIIMQQHQQQKQKNSSTNQDNQDQQLQKQHGIFTSPKKRNELISTERLIIKNIGFLSVIIQSIPYFSNDLQLFILNSLHALFQDYEANFINFYLIQKFSPIISIPQCLLSILPATSNKDMGKSSLIIQLLKKVSHFMIKAKELKQLLMLQSFPSSSSSSSSLSKRLNEEEYLKIVLDILENPIQLDEDDRDNSGSDLSHSFLFRGRSRSGILIQPFLHWPGSSSYSLMTWFSLNSLETAIHPIVLFSVLQLSEKVDQNPMPSSLSTSHQSIKKIGFVICFQLNEKNLNEIQLFYNLYSFNSPMQRHLLMSFPLTTFLSKWHFIAISHVKGGLMKKSSLSLLINDLDGNIMKKDISFPRFKENIEINSSSSSSSSSNFMIAAAIGCLHPILFQQGSNANEIEKIAADLFFDDDEEDQQYSHFQGKIGSFYIFAEALSMSFFQSIAKKGRNDQLLISLYDQQQQQQPTSSSSMNLIDSGNLSNALILAFHPLMTFEEIVFNCLHQVSNHQKWRVIPNPIESSPAAPSPMAFVESSLYGTLLADTLVSPSPSPSSNLLTAMNDLGGIFLFFQLFFQAISLQNNSFILRSLQLIITILSSSSKQQQEEDHQHDNEKDSYERNLIFMETKGLIILNYCLREKIDYSSEVFAKEILNLLKKFFFLYEKDENWKVLIWKFFFLDFEIITKFPIIFIQRDYFILLHELIYQNVSLFQSKIGLEPLFIGLLQYYPGSTKNKSIDYHHHKTQQESSSIIIMNHHHVVVPLEMMKIREIIFQIIYFMMIHTASSLKSDPLILLNALGDLLNLLVLESNIECKYQDLEFLIKLFQANNHEILEQLSQAFLSFHGFIVFSQIIASNHIGIRYLAWLFLCKIIPLIDSLHNNLPKERDILYSWLIFLWKEMISKSIHNYNNNSIHQGDDQEEQTREDVVSLHEILMIFKMIHQTMFGIALLKKDPKNETATAAPNSSPFPPVLLYQPIASDTLRLPKLFPVLLEMLQQETIAINHTEAISSSSIRWRIDLLASLFENLQTLQHFDAIVSNLSWESSVLDFYSAIYAQIIQQEQQQQQQSKEGREELLNYLNLIVGNVFSKMIFISIQFGELKENSSSVSFSSFTSSIPLNSYLSLSIENLTALFKKNQRSPGIRLMKNIFATIRVFVLQRKFDWDGLVFSMVNGMMEKLCQLLIAVNNLPLSSFSSSSKDVVIREKMLSISIWFFVDEFYEFFAFPPVPALSPSQKKTKLNPTENDNNADEIKVKRDENFIASLILMSSLITSLKPENNNNSSVDSLQSATLQDTLGHLFQFYTKQSLSFLLHRSLKPEEKEQQQEEKLVQSFQKLLQWCKSSFPNIYFEESLFILAKMTTSIAESSINHDSNSFERLFIPLLLNIIEDHVDRLRKSFKVLLSSTEEKESIEEISSFQQIILQKVQSFLSPVTGTSPIPSSLSWKQWIKQMEIILQERIQKEKFFLSNRFDEFGKLKSFQEYSQQFEKKLQSLQEIENEMKGNILLFLSNAKNRYLFAQRSLERQCEKARVKGCQVWKDLVEELHRERSPWESSSSSGQRVRWFIDTASVLTKSPPLLLPCRVKEIDTGEDPLQAQQNGENNDEIAGEGGLEGNDTNVAEEGEGNLPTTNKDPEEEGKAEKNRKVANEDNSNHDDDVQHLQEDLVEEVDVVEREEDLDKGDDENDDEHQRTLSTSTESSLEVLCELILPGRQSNKKPTLTIPGKLKLTKRKIKFIRSKSSLLVSNNNNNEEEEEISPENSYLRSSFPSIITWSTKQIQQIFQRFYYFQWNSLEIQFSMNSSLSMKSTNLFFHFFDTNNMKKCLSYFMKKILSSSSFAYSIPSWLGTHPSRILSKVIFIPSSSYYPIDGNTEQERSITSAWQRYEMSTFDYLLKLNEIAGRTRNDLHQYPIFPWILADYSSDYLDLKNPKTFRQLDLPIGAQTHSQRKLLKEKFSLRMKEYQRNQQQQQQEESMKKKKQQQQQQSQKNQPKEDESITSARSSSSVPLPYYFEKFPSRREVVLRYLGRIEPFTSYYLHEQPAELSSLFPFQSFEEEWDQLNSSSLDFPPTELLPEMFCCPEIFENLNNHPLIPSFQLPPWAKDSHDFIMKHRAALESDFVRGHLHQWIDLIFGVKQQPIASPTSFSTSSSTSSSLAVSQENYHYDTAGTWFNIYSSQCRLDPNQLKALQESNPFAYQQEIEKIHEYGQLPCQLLTKDHVLAFPYDHLDYIAPIASKPLESFHHYLRDCCDMDIKNKKHGIYDDCSVIPYHEIVVGSPIAPLIRLFVTGSDGFVHVLNSLGEIISLHWTTFSIDSIPPHKIRVDLTTKGKRLAIPFENHSLLAHSSSTSSSSEVLLMKKSNKKFVSTSSDPFVFRPVKISKYVREEKRNKKQQQARAFSVNSPMTMTMTMNKMAAGEEELMNHELDEHQSALAAPDGGEIGDAAHSPTSHLAPPPPVPPLAPLMLPVSPTPAAESLVTPAAPGNHHQPHPPSNNNNNRLISAVVNISQQNHKNILSSHLSFGDQLIAFIPEQKLVLSCGHPGTSIFLSSMENGRLLQSIDGHHDVVTCMTLIKQVHPYRSPSSTSSSSSSSSYWLISGSRDCSLIVRSIEFPRSSSSSSSSSNSLPKISLIRRIPGHDDTITSIIANISLDLLISGAIDGTILIHSLSTGQLIRSFKNRIPPENDGEDEEEDEKIAWRVSWMGLSITDGILITYSNEKNILITYTINGNYILSKEISETLYCLRISEDGKVLLSGGSACLVVLRWIQSLELANDGSRKALPAIIDGLPINLNDPQSLEINGFNAPIRSLTLTSKERHLLVGLETGELCILALNAQYIRNRLQGKLQSIGIL